MTAILSKKPFVFVICSDALQCAMQYEASVETTQLYEVIAVFDNDRTPTGFQVRVKDVDGFAIGWIEDQ